jgi:hypothetical protein
MIMNEPLLDRLELDSPSQEWGRLQRWKGETNGHEYAPSEYQARRGSL